MSSKTRKTKLKRLFFQKEVSIREKDDFSLICLGSIHNLYHETVTAHDKELIILSTVGLRALIEAMVADKIDPSTFKNNLESKINSLKPYFQESVINGLHDFRLVANKAAHELSAPESLNIHHALYIVEGMLEYFYGIEDHVRIYQDYRNPNDKVGKKRKRKTDTEGN